MQKHKILIVENDPVEAEKIELILSQAGYDITNITEDYDDTLMALKETPPDLAILDIELDDYLDGGIRVAQFMRNNYPNIPFIFLTSKNDPRLSSQALKLSPKNFLQKQESNEQRLPLAVRLVLKEQEELRKYRIRILDKDHLIVTSEGGEEIIERDDIYFISANGAYCQINYSDKSGETFTENLTSTTKALTSALEFIRIHKSYMINKKYIKRVSRSTGEVTLKNKKVFSIGKTYANNLFSFLNS